MLNNLKSNNIKLMLFQLLRKKNSYLMLHNSQQIIPIINKLLKLKIKNINKILFKIPLILKRFKIILQIKRKMNSSYQNKACKNIKFIKIKTKTKFQLN